MTYVKLLFVIYLLNHVDGNKNKQTHPLERPDLVDLTDLYDLRLNDLYVDKSIFVKKFFSAGKIVRILRPNGWGKTTNLNTLKRFLDIEIDSNGRPLPIDHRKNRLLFVGGDISSSSSSSSSSSNNKTTKLSLKPLKIADEKHVIDMQGTYPVITIDFGNITGNGYTIIENKLKRTIADLFNERRFYLRSNLKPDSDEALTYDRLCAGQPIDRDELETSVLFLSELLYRHFRRPIYILIDDYDVPVVNLFLNLVDKIARTSTGTVKNEQEIIDKAASSRQLIRVRNLIERLMWNCLNQNDALGQALLTGIFDVFVNYTISNNNNNNNLTRVDTDENNIDDNIIIDNMRDEEYQDCYGFYDDEVNEMLAKTANVQLDDRLDVRRWYVYNFGNEMYDSLSIRRFLANGGKFADYWTDRTSTRLVEFVLSSKASQYFTQNLSDEELITSRIYERLYLPNVTRHAGTVLFFSGFLSVAICDYAVTAEVCLCNRQMSNVLSNKMIAWLCRELNVTVKIFESMAEDLTIFKVNDFREKLRLILPITTNTTRNDDNEVRVTGVMKSLKRFIDIDSYVVEINLPPSSPKQSFSIIAKSNNRRKNAVILEYRRENPNDTRSLLDALFEKDVRYIESEDCDLNRELYPYIEQLLKMTVLFYANNDFRLEYHIDRNQTESETIAARLKTSRRRPKFINDYSNNNINNNNINNNNINSNNSSTTVKPKPKPKLRRPIMPRKKTKRRKV